MLSEFHETLIRQWLDQAARAAGLRAIAPEFIDRVFVRLHKGAREYGADNYRAVPLDHLLCEAAEEGDDIAGWLVLAGVRAMMTQELDPEIAQRFQWRLMEAVALGFRAWKLLQEAREMAETPAARTPSGVGWPE